MSTVLKSLPVQVCVSSAQSMSTFQVELLQTNYQQDGPQCRENLSFTPITLQKDQVPSCHPCTSASDLAKLDRRARSVEPTPHGFSRIKSYAPHFIRLHTFRPYEEVEYIKGPFETPAQRHNASEILLSTRQASHEVGQRASGTLSGHHEWFLRDSPRHPYECFDRHILRRTATCVPRLHAYIPREAPPNFVMMYPSVKSTLLFAASAAAKIYYAGVAESGGEFGVYSPTATNGTGLPGRFGVDYAFLNQSTLPIWIQQNKASESPTVFHSRHTDTLLQINTFRVAFLLERMCPLAYGLGKRFNETYFSEFNDAICAITEAGGYAILDPHNYMRQVHGGHPFTCQPPRDGLTLLPSPDTTTRLSNLPLAPLSATPPTLPQRRPSNLRTFGTSLPVAMFGTRKSSSAS